MRNNNKIEGNLSMSEEVIFMPKGCKVPSLKMRRISCLLRLLLLPEMGQRARFLSLKIFNL